MIRSIIILLFLANISFAHEMTPTYPQLTKSYVDKVLVTKLSIFNSREDVEYYEIGVFTKDWKQIPFATEYKVLQVKYQERKNFSIYIREVDVDKAIYICSISKLSKGLENKTSISSKICSKIGRRL